MKIFGDTIKHGTNLVIQSYPSTITIAIRDNN